MKRQHPSCKVLTLAVFSFGMLLSGCSNRYARHDSVPSQTAHKVETIEMDELHITVGKNASGGLGIEDGFDVYDAPTLFQEASALFDAEKYAEAAEKYEKLAIEFEDSAWVPPSLFNAALSLEVLGKFSDAAVRYKRVFSAFPSSKQAKEAGVRQAACLAELALWVQSAEVLAQLEQRDDLNVAERLETIARHGLALFEMKDLGGADAKFQKALALYEARKAEEAPPNTFFVAMSQFYVAHVAHLRFRDLPLRLPQKQLALDVDTKAKAFLLANNKYVEAIKLKNPTWATAAGYHVGTLYRDLYDSMLGAPVPKELEKNGSKVLYDLLLRGQLRGLLTSAKNVLESNVKMADRLGVKNGWTERSNEQLAELDRLIGGLDDPPANSETSPTSPTRPNRPAPEQAKQRATL